MILLFLALLGVSFSENIQVTLNSNYLDYVAEVVDRIFVSGYGPTLIGKDLPGAEGTVYKIANLTMDTIDLGYSAGKLHDGRIILSLNNATASVSGYYEAYTFWTTTGNLTLNVSGSLELELGVTPNNTFSITSCAANYTQLELDFHRTSVNWLAPMLKPIVRSTIQDTLCNLMEKFVVNKTNEILEGLPETVSGSGGEAKMELQEIGITPDYIILELQVGENKNNTLAPFAKLHQDMCIQMREESLNTFASIFVPPGTIGTTINVMDLIYGKEDAASRDTVELHIQNNNTLNVGFGAAHEILGQVDIGTEILKTPVGATETETLGRIAMGATIVGKCNDPGKQHVAEYAVNRLVKQNRFIELERFNLAISHKVMVGCSDMRLRESFIEGIIQQITS